MKDEIRVRIDPANYTDEEKKRMREIYDRIKKIPKAEFKKNYDEWAKVMAAGMQNGYLLKVINQNGLPRCLSLIKSKIKLPNK